MKTMHKRVLAMLMALVLMFSCTAFASAAEIMPRERGQLAHDDGYTSTSVEVTSFSFHQVPNSVSTSVDIRANGACIIYFRIKDANGNNLGTNTFNFTRNGYMTNVPIIPATLSRGDYTVEVWSNTNGVYYLWQLFGTI